MRKAFLLTRQWRDTHEGISLEFWWASEQGPFVTLVTAQEAVFFVLQEQLPQIKKHLRPFSDWRLGQVELRNFINQPVCALYVKHQRLVREITDHLDRVGLAYWEADIKPTERFLMERFITATAMVIPQEQEATDTFINPRFKPLDQEVSGRPDLKVLSLDIETSMDAKHLFSIALWGDNFRKVFMVGQGTNQDFLEFFPDETRCLRAFLNCIADYDPDVFIGWSVVQFDLWILQQKCQQLNLDFTLGRHRQKCHWRQEEMDAGRRFVIIPGRVALDGIELLKAANTRFESFSLQSVSEALLGESKLLTGNDRGQDIQLLYKTNQLALAEYNLRDCELVWKIFEQEKLLHFAMERSQLTGLLLDRIGGSVAAFEYAYLPRLHRMGFVAPNLGEMQSDIFSPGGYVMNSQPGIYDNILVLDFKSLYPNIMRSFLIDPCAFWLAEHENLSDEETVPGFNGARFAREGAILPGIIAQLSAARDQAKEEKNAPLSHAIKIIMNSFYGVLGSTGCRFFDPRVSSSITLRGHEIIQASRDWIEQQGYQVIYGDTDSLFVWLENNCVGKVPKTADQCQKIGQRLARELNIWLKKTLREQYRIKSTLEIQFETHYLHFLMPTIRGSDLGTKKRYAGLVDVNGKRELIFKGLESARTDWTSLAKHFQQELYKRVFEQEEYAEFVRQTRQDLLSGKRDQDLIYKKRLRQNLDAYQKNVPPHAQAARKLHQITGRKLRSGDWIHYVITLNGPEPVEYQQAAMDYEHYLNKQLMPVADTILYFLDQSMSSLVEDQLTLFH
jgi:DNA polymerase-2